MPTSEKGASIINNIRPARRTAWPDFVPEEMAERFLNENQQVQKVVGAELEQIDEEEKKGGEAGVGIVMRADSEGATHVGQDGRLAWQYEKSETKKVAGGESGKGKEDFWGSSPIGV